MTIQELVAKDYAGSMSHPCCEITGCLEENLHDIVLTKDGGVYLLCEKHMHEYMELASAKWHKAWKIEREQNKMHEGEKQELEFYRRELWKDYFKKIARY